MIYKGGPKQVSHQYTVFLSRALEWLGLFEVSVGSIHSKQISLQYYTKSILDSG